MVIQHRNTVDIHPASLPSAVREGRAAKLAAIGIFILVKNFEHLRRLAETVQFARHHVPGNARRTHSGIPADAIQSSRHGRPTGQQSFATQTPGVAIAKSALQRPVDEQIGLA